MKESQNGRRTAEHKKEGGQVVMLGELKAKRLVGLITMILLAVSSTYQFALAASSPEKTGAESTIASSTAESEKTLRAQAAEYMKAFAAGDAELIANMWMPDGTYTDPYGHEFKGRAAIKQFFASNFKEAGLQPLEIIVDTVRFPSDNVAIEEGHCRLLKGPSSGSMTRYMVVHIRGNDGKWLMASVTESGSPPRNDNSLADLNWLVGNWTANGPKGTAHLNVDWAGDRKFLRCTVTTDTPNTSKKGDVQIIGWNPRTQQLISWHFDSRGGFGYGKWMRDGQTWVENSFGVESDGTMDSSINELHKVDDNTFIWKSTGRCIESSSLPDIKEITVKRDR